MLSIIVIITVTAFVFAADGDELEYLDQEVTLKEGWNLVSVYTLSNYLFILDTELSKYDKDNLEDLQIKAIFFYDFFEKSYIMSYPQNEVDKILIFKERVNSNFDNYGLHANSALWVYSDKRQVISFRTTDGPLMVEDVKMKLGWNFLTITPDMKGKTINQIKGNCDIEKLYSYETSVQKWSNNLAYDNFMDEELTDDSIWSGIVIKLNSDCSFGGDSVNPPQIPN